MTKGGVKKQRQEKYLKFDNDSKNTLEIKETEIKFYENVTIIRRCVRTTFCFPNKVTRYSIKSHNLVELPYNVLHRQSDALQVEN